MGGHSAWRKRVARGETAKGLGGAIMRHRPHLGRKGKDRILNRKGHIGGGNPKKKKQQSKDIDDICDDHISITAAVIESMLSTSKLGVIKAAGLVVVVGYLSAYIFYVLARWQTIKSK